MGTYGFYLSYVHREISLKVAARQPLRLVEVSFWWSSVCPVQLRTKDRAFLALIVGCSWSICIWFVPSVPLLDLNLSFLWSALGKRSTVCLSSREAFFCGMVGFPRCLTGWVVCIVWVGNVGKPVARVRVCLTTVVIIGNAGTICVVLGSVFFRLSWRHWFR